MYASDCLDDRREKNTESMGEQRICGDVLLVPMAIPGHINPLMYVAKWLMKHGLTMTMVLPEDEQAVMKEHMGAEGMEGFHLELVESTKNVRGGGQGLPSLCTNFGLACEPYLNRVFDVQQAGGEGPKCMIVAQFMGWPESWARKLQIPRYVNIITPATFGFVMYNLSALIAKGLLDKKDENPIVDLPGILKLHLSDLPKAAQHCPTFITNGGDTFKEAAGLLLNTFYSLESSTIDAFHAQVRAECNGKGPKILSVGPMLPPEYFEESTFAGTATESKCIQWLDTRPASSVVYIAFGSISYLPPPQILELANGLEASGESFLWVLRVKAEGDRRVDVSELLPPGFQERTKDRGLVYPEFAPQLQILSHPSTGGFLTHCGWNSSLESISRGVPMIGWPILADQKLCCRVLVDQAKAVVEVRPGLTGSTDLVKSAEVEKALKLLMTQPEGQVLKKRALELQHQARVAMSPGGLSVQNLNTLVKDIKG